MAIPGVHAAQARLGRYELLARLATGGMGEIFLARLEGAAGFEKLFVVKRILPHLADDTRFRQMLIAEARIASMLSHANICQVYELGETDGQLYIVMEYLEGISVLPLLRKASKEATPLDLGFIAGVIQQTCDALHYAHELRDRNGEALGIVHRDVTPSNVFVTESGVAKVLDFGIAKARGAVGANTQTGTVKGKYAYMAPEQLRGGSVDRRVDVFALGVVVYEMLALRRLFQRKTDYLTFRAVMEQPIPDVRRYRPDTPESVVEVLMRALDRDPGQRFETARQFGTAMLDALGGKRAWSQGELSDFVRANFANDIGKRHQQVASAVNRTASGKHSLRSTMPIIAPEDPPPSDDEDDDGFPSVETEVDGAPPFMPQAAPRNAGMSGDFVGGTPPPFGLEPTNSTPGLQPLRGPVLHPPAPNTVIVQQPRSLLWPLVAVAMVLIAGGALFLVWKQTQTTQPPPMITIQQGPAGSALPIAPTGSAGSAGAAVEPVGSAGSATDPIQKVPPGPRRERPPADPMQAYRSVIERLRPRVEQCLRDHKDQVVKGDITVTLKIADNGHADEVVLEPAHLGEGALGDCMRKVLSTGKFPARAANVRIPFSVKKT